MEKTLPAVEAPLEAQVRPLPEPVPAYSCGVASLRVFEKMVASLEDFARTC